MRESSPPLIEKLKTPGQKTIDEVAQFLNIDKGALVKTLIVKGKGEEAPFIALCLKGDDALNEIKAAKHPLVASPLQLIDEEMMLHHLNIPLGFVGPIDLKIPVIVDHHAHALARFICGANERDAHYQHAVWERDVPSYQTYDLRTVKEGDLSVDGAGPLKSCRGIEVGHIFQLGEKYAKVMGAKVLNEQGQLQTLTMGCYGLGISRVVAAAIEQHHDDKGIVWPAAMAPFQVVIIPINGKRVQKVKESAEELYNQLNQNNIEVLLEDREERPGMLFADHDLLGIPHRIVISERHLENQEVEYKPRNESEVKLIKVQDVLKNIAIF